MQMPRTVMTGLLSVVLVNQPLLAAQQEPAGQAPVVQVPLAPVPPPSEVEARPPVAGHELTPDQRILHLLNRFAFGPTPESIGEVRRLGINKWFDRQLEPSKLPMHKLQAYPAMDLPVDQLMVAFPTNAEIRQVINGKLPIPDDPRFSAVYHRHIALYQEKQAKKAAEKTAAPAPGATPSSKMDGKPAEPATDAVQAAVPAKEAAEMSAAETTPDTGRPTFGNVLIEHLLALPPATRTERVLAMQPAAYEEFRSNLRGPERAKFYADLTFAQREILADFDNPSRAVVDELQSRRLLLDIYSERQLWEVMNTFWLNHFNVYLHKNEETPYYMVSYERDVIAPYSLGSFEDLLTAVASSPAMLLYLDNSSSTGPNSVTAQRQKERIANGKGGKTTPPGINENYARELMELHTLGVNGGYTQKDVTEVAKVFTGWTVDRPADGGDFKFDEDRHEPGTKIVLGHKIKEHGAEEGLQVLHMLATSPATAKFISHELAVAFVSDKPPASLVDRMAHTFEKHDGNIGEVLKTMIKSPEFWSADVYQAKVKTPLEYVVSAVRASRADVINPQPLINALNQMGMPLYACVPPTGYASTADAWINTGALVTRMNFSLSLASNKFPGVKADWMKATGVALAKADETTDLRATPAIERLLIPTGISDKTREAVSMQTKTAGLSPDKQLDLSAGLLLGSPEFQRR